MRTQRLIGLDIFRGWVILLMVLFHLAYDLNYFKLIHINLHQDTFWVYARYLIVIMFLVTVGISLALTHHPKIQWNKMLKRTLVLGVASALVSFSTYIQFPQTWVYFGILHFILLASLLGLFFLPYPGLTLLSSIVILWGSAIGWLHMHTLFSFVQKPLHLPPAYTEDLVIFFPWFAVVLLGISLVQYQLHRPLLQHSFFSHNVLHNRFLALMGRHALLIYLLHQPILFAVIGYITA